MKTSIIVAVVYLFAIFVDQFSSEVIDTGPDPKNCNGRVILSSIDESHTNIEFNATKRRKRSPRIKLKKTHFQKVTVEGDCCWKAWSSKRGGSFHRLTSAKLYVPFDPNPIRAIEFLDENCSR